MSKEVQAYSTAGQAEAMRDGFEDKDYEVTCCCEKLCCGSVTLHLGPEEVDNEKTVCCGICAEKKRIPYGELSGVDKNTGCFCIANFVAGDLNGTNKKSGNPKPFCPGCGCSGNLVDEIVEELKARQTARGAAGNLQRIEKQTRDLIRLEDKMDALLSHFSIDPQGMERFYLNPVDPAKPFLLLHANRISWYR